MEKVILLFSGGLDSSVLLYQLIREFEVLALSFNYGQPNRNKEIDAAIEICKTLKVEHKITKLPTMQWSDHPYIWGRNSCFLIHAAIEATKINVKKIFIGVNASDEVEFPDCRIIFIENINKLFKNLNGPEVIAPFIAYTKKDIICRGRRLETPFGDTYTCYDGKNQPCNACMACRVRANAFSELEIQDV